MHTCLEVFLHNTFSVSMQKKSRRQYISYGDVFLIVKELSYHCSAPGKIVATQLTTDVSRVVRLMQDPSP